MLTRRGASALLAIVLFSFVGWLSGNPTFAVASSALILIVMIESLQLSLTVKIIKKLKIERRITDYQLEVGRETDVSLRLLNPSSRATAYLIVRDKVPEALVVRSGSPRSTLRIGGNDEATMHFTIQAAQIGDYEIGGLTVEAVDPLGFASFSLSMPVKSKLEVYPRLRSAEVSRIVGASRIPHVALVGQKAISNPGLGSDFRGIREYFPGDDFRRIAWKAVAKSPRHSLMLREFEADRNLNLVFALDAKESFLDGSVGHRKLDYTIEAIVAVAYAASLGGERVLLGLGDSCYTLAVPGQSRQWQLIRILRATYNIQPTGMVNLWSLVECLLREVRQRSLIIVVTDLENPNPAEFKALGKLLHRHAVQVVAMKTISLFAKAGIDNSLVKIGYDAAGIHEKRALEQLSCICRLIGVPLKSCEPDEILGVLSQIYLAAKKSGMIVA